MAGTCLKPFSDLEADYITPAENAILGKLKTARWNFDSANNRWCVLIGYSDAETTRSLVNKLANEGVIHRPAMEDHNRNANEAGQSNGARVWQSGAMGMASSGFASMILALDEESLSNLGITVGQVATASKRTTRLRDIPL